MRFNNSKTDFGVFIWMLALCVISFVLNIKEAIEGEPDWVDIFVCLMLIFYFISCVIRAKNKMKNE